jgi:hypothetical protein
VANRPVNFPTLAIAIVALVVSLLSLVVAFGATRMIAASDDNNASPPAAQTTGMAEPAENSSTESTLATPAPTDTGVVEPQPDYTAAYEDEELRIPTGVRVDLDEPRVNATIGVDFAYLEYQGAAFDRYNAAAEVRSSNATPQDCASAIQTSPLTTPIAASDGLVLCIQTSADEASQQGVSQKMARISIKSIDKQDTVTVLVTAWNVPK